MPALADNAIPLPEGGGGGGGGGGVLPPPLGTEHSLTDLLGIGSEPNVATLQTKLPLSTLNTNWPAAPKATLVDWDTEQVSPILQMVV